MLQAGQFPGDHKIRTASNDEKIFCVYEYTDDNGDKNGIYYFEIDKNVEQTDAQMQATVEKSAHIALVEDRVYEKLELAQLYLDVDGDFISLTFVPNEERGTSKKAYSGKIQDGKFILCKTPQQPTTPGGDIVKVNTEFTKSPKKAIKVFEFAEGSCHIEGHG